MHESAALSPLSRLWKAWSGYLCLSDSPSPNHEGLLHLSESSPWMVQAVVFPFPDLMGHISEPLRTPSWRSYYKLAV